MYKMGTGDCFTVKFLKGGKVSFKMMIDCGCWSGTKERLEPFLEELKQDVEGKLDVLVVTHEHKDHVLGFERGKDLFTDEAFQVGRVWMAWTEKDGDDKIEQWKNDYGQKKRSLAAAAKELSDVVVRPDFTNQFTGSHEEAGLSARRQEFAKVLTGFAELHATKQYVEALAGMAVVKDEIAGDNVSYFEPGHVIENVLGLEGVRIFVLGPPTVYDDIKQEEGPAGQAYEHNDQLEDTDAFAAAVDAFDGANSSRPLPFDDYYVSDKSRDQAAYNDPQEVWRRIDYDWLFSAGSLALRMNSMTNNLSLVLAIEFIQSGKVLLFPGDAEFGSWRSWHQIDWETKVEKLTTEKLLNRVVFYKVAHHLSHHGTARSIGLDMMTHPELIAMATLDYDVIPPGWMSTMPNVGIIKDLLKRTKGRTIIMNTKELPFDRRHNTLLAPKIKEYRKRMTVEERKAFEKSLEDSKHFISLTLDV
jgi:beta-lactamase superfamily II metal-dependent hydrolase